MRRFTIIFLALMLAFAGVAYGGETFFTVSKTTSVAGDNVVAAPGISGKQFVLDSAVMQDGSTTASTIYLYYGSGKSGPAVAQYAVADTAVTITNTTSAAFARTGDIIYEISRATDPSQTSFIYHGVVASVTFSTTADTEYMTRTASNSEAVIATGDTIWIGRPQYGVRGTGATDLNAALYNMTLTTDGAEIYFMDDYHLSSGFGTVLVADGMQAGAGTDYVVTPALIPRGMISRDWILRWDTGAGVDGEIDLLTGHYVLFQ